MAKQPASEKKSPRRKPTRRQLATDELVDELAALRGITADIVDHVRLELEGGLIELRRTVTSDAQSRAAKVPVRNLEAALKRVRALRVKPEKGRLKDLRRLAALLDELDELLTAGR